MLAGPLSVRRVRRAAAAHHVGPRRATPLVAREGARRVADRQRRHHSGPRPLRRVPRRRHDRHGARVGELDEEMVFESRVGETFLLGASYVAHRGDHPRSRARLARRPASRARCRSGAATPPGGRSSSAGASARMVRELRAAPRETALARLIERPRASTRCAAREPAAVPGRPGRGDGRGAGRSHDRRSSAAATSSATGACACSRPSAAGSTRRGRWRSPRGCARETRRRASRRCGRTTASSCASRRPTSRPTSRLLLPDRRRDRGARARAARQHRALRGEVPRGGGARAAAAAAAGRAGARRSGSSASAPPICSPWPRSTARSRCCSRPIASACATCSTCRRCVGRCCGASRDGAHPRRHRRHRRCRRRSPPSLLFGYVANYIYEGDAPLAERRAQALAIDQAQLRELLGDAELRELLDADALERARARAAAPRRAAYRARSADGVHDLLLGLGDLSTRRARARGRPVAGRPREPLEALVARAARARASPWPASRATSPSRMRAGTAMRSACRCRRRSGGAARAGARRRSAISRTATRARTGRSPRTSSPRATASARADGRGGAAPHGRRGQAARGRVPARRHASRVVRSRRAAHAAPPLARAAAAGGRARRARRARPAHHDVAGRRRAGARGLDALLDAIESLQGAPLRRVDPRDARSCRRASRLRARRSRRARRRRRGRVVRRRAARRARRPHRALPDRSPAARSGAPRRSTAPLEPPQRGAHRRGTCARAAPRSSPPCTRRRRRVPGRDGRRAVEPRVEGLVTNDTFTRAARVHGAARAPRSPRAA